MRIARLHAAVIPPRHMPEATWEDLTDAEREQLLRSMRYMEVAQRYKVESTTVWAWGTRRGLVK